MGCPASWPSAVSFYRPLCGSPPRLPGPEVRDEQGDVPLSRIGICHFTRSTAKCGSPAGLGNGQTPNPMSTHGLRLLLLKPLLVEALCSVQSGRLWAEDLRLLQWFFFFFFPLSLLGRRRTGYPFLQPSSVHGLWKLLYWPENFYRLILRTAINN